MRNEADSEDFTRIAMLRTTRVRRPIANQKEMPW